MIIYGRSDLEHDKHLLNFLEVCRKNITGYCTLYQHQFSKVLNILDHKTNQPGNSLNPDKMQFRLPQVSFFGHQWSAKGLSPDPKKIAVVKRMNLPQDVGDNEEFPRTCELSQQI